MPSSGFLGLEIYNTILIFEISTIKFIKLQNFVKKQKCLYLGPKIPY